MQPEFATEAHQELAEGDGVTVTELPEAMMTEFAKSPLWPRYQVTTLELPPGAVNASVSV